MNDSGSPAWRLETALQLIMSALVLLALLGPSAVGCGPGKQAILKYADDTNAIIDGLSNCVVEFNKYWAAPARDQGGMKQALADFRKKLTEAQEMLERIDAPEPCAQLDDMMDLLLSNGRVFADMLTPFADYMADMAPVAVQIDEVVQTLKHLQGSNDIPSGLAVMVANVNKANTTFRTVMAPGVFTGMHQKFSEFIAELVSEFDRAQEAAGTQTREETPQQDAGEEQESTPRSESWRYSSAGRILNKVPDEWARFTGEWSALMDAAREAVKLKFKQAEFENILTQAKALAQSLKKQYQ